MFPEHIAHMPGAFSTASIEPQMLAQRTNCCLAFVQRLSDPLFVHRITNTHIHKPDPVSGLVNLPREYSPSETTIPKANIVPDPRYLILQGFLTLLVSQTLHDVVNRPRGGAEDIRDKRYWPDTVGYRPASTLQECLVCWSEIQSQQFSSQLPA